jgi:alkanesulfonate monooxygenase SsuD/methylene tetrahydromethanopterin reductase-like flavin-dependent oxidoreductase (luciferase family)
MLALGAICADSDVESANLAASVRALGLRIRRGDARPIPTIEAAQDELAAAGPLGREEPSEWPRHIDGSPATVRTKLREIARALNLDELMIVTIVHDHRARLRSYELLADACALAKRDGL